MRDLGSNISPVQLVAPAVQAATVAGGAVDLLGFDSAVMVVNTGAIAGAGNFTAKVQESDTTTSGDFADVGTADLRGAFPASLAENTVTRVGYIGRKRYVRLVITKNSGTSIAAGAVLIRGTAAGRPVS
ncbi:hypothetical protein V5F59_10105 [Xanthobacter autotrophicus DSM 431]|uniref:hypothetical protein n=1 Tax=Xanthobacter nonsaccharivorans TaxID=3119912 RepID=UPI00372AB2C4